MHSGVAQSLCYTISEAACCQALYFNANSEIEKKQIPVSIRSFWFNGPPSELRFDSSFFDHCRSYMKLHFKKISADSIGNISTQIPCLETTKSLPKEILSIKTGVNEYKEADSISKKDDGMSDDDYNIAKLFCQANWQSSAHLLSYFTSFCFQNDPYDEYNFICFPFCQLPLNH